MEYEDGVQSKGVDEVGEQLHKHRHCRVPVVHAHDGDDDSGEIDKRTDFGSTVMQQPVL